MSIFWLCRFRPLELANRLLRFTSRSVGRSFFDDPWRWVPLLLRLKDVQSFALRVLDVSNESLNQSRSKSQMRTMWLGFRFVDLWVSLWPRDRSVDGAIQEHPIHCSISGKSLINKMMKSIDLKFLAFCPVI